ncbi:MAG: hypothetical protein U0228_36820 [Myxococcaceae bacterium]
MRTLLAAVAVLVFGCGPEDELTPPAATTTPQALEATPLEPETSLRLEIVNTEQGLIFRLVNDPVEERFFHKTNVTQPAPQMPTPPCPACR